MSTAGASPESELAPPPSGAAVDPDGADGSAGMRRVYALVAACFAIWVALLVLLERAYS